MENYIDRGIYIIVKPLLNILDFEVLQLTSSIIKLTRDKEYKKYNFLRIYNPNTTYIHKVEIVPIQAWRFELILDREELRAKIITHITKAVNIKVEEGLISDLLILTD